MRVTIRILSLIAMLCMPASIEPVSAQAVYQNATCDELWIARNSVFARNGYCFKTPQAQSFFGLACFPPFGQLTVREQDVVNTITQWEATKGCKVTLPAFPSTPGTGKIDVFVMAGGEPEFDACGGTGEVAGLDPRGDGFLSVRSGPGGAPFSEMDRLFNGSKVYICDRRGPWFGVVYEAPGQATANGCGVATPWILRQPYSGPCRYGWIHSKYVTGIAG